MDYNQGKAYNNQMAGFSAAACAGYAAATIELKNPKMFNQIKTFAKFSSVFEKQLCKKRKIFIGAKGNYLKQFEEGRKVALVNAGQLNKSMSKSEFGQRVNQCGKITKHYTKMIRELLSKKK